jgi:hypothetical protein
MHPARHGTLLAPLMHGWNRTYRERGRNYPPSIFQEKNIEGRKTRGGGTPCQSRRAAR